VGGGGIFTIADGASRDAFIPELCFTGQVQALCCRSSGQDEGVCLHLPRRQDAHSGRAACAVKHKPRLSGELQLAFSGHPIGLSSTLFSSKQCTLDGLE